MKNNILLISAIILMFSISYIESDELVDTYMQNARSYFIFKDYEKAFSSINFVLRSSKGEDTSAKVYLLAEEIYYEYINQLINNNNEKVFNELLDNLDKYPAVMSERIAIMVDEKKAKDIELSKKQEKEKLEAKIKEDQRRKEEDEKQKIFEAERREEEKKKKEFEWKMKEKELDHKLKMVELNKVLVEERKKENNEKNDDDNFNKLLLTLLSKEGQNDAKSDFNVPFVLMFIGGFFLIILFFLMIFMRQSQIQQQRMFEYSIRNSNQQPQLIPIPIAPLLQSPEHKKVKEIEYHSANNENMDKISELIKVSSTYAIKIDEATGRKNSSKNVAEYIYKISKYLGYSEIDSMLYYAIGLIYDIGFLNIDSAILTKDELTDEEFELIKSHTKLGLNMIHFIDDDFKSIVKEAILKHHESLDGSGYPEGLEADNIPYIARVIKAVESFIALTSLRSYKQITDNQTALLELKKELNKYDIEIIDALINIV